jgi:hypothetical protein
LVITLPSAMYWICDSSFVPLFIVKESKYPSHRRSSSHRLSRYVILSVNSSLTRIVLRLEFQGCGTIVSGTVMFLVGLELGGVIFPWSSAAVALSFLASYLWYCSFWLSGSRHDIQFFPSDSLIPPRILPAS